MASISVYKCFIREGEFIRVGDGTRSTSWLSPQDRYALGIYEFPREPEKPFLNHDARRKLRLESRRLQRKRR